MATFNPEDVYSLNEIVFGSPQRYIQGPNTICKLGQYISLLASARSAAILITEGGVKRHGKDISKSFLESKIESAYYHFQGESSFEEVDRVVSEIKAKSTKQLPDIVVAVGGGKCIDAGKCVAHRLGVPVIIVPTLASNDAPCSALSVLYTPEGVSKAVEFFPRSPTLVCVDSDVIVHSPVRLFVAGMGDAMATYYEARAAYNNPKGKSMLGGRPPLSALAIGEICAKSLFKYGVAAKADVEKGKLTDAVEKVIEANTLLSGLGFESGGLAAAHAVAQGLTHVKEVHHHNLHGELVSIGTCTQLVFEKDYKTWAEVATFLASVGLPIHLGQVKLKLQPEDKNQNDGSEIKTDLDLVIKGALELGFISNQLPVVTFSSLKHAVLEAHSLGVTLAESLGQSAWAKLHNVSKL